VQYDSKKCPGRCHIADGEVIKFTDNHNHVPDSTDFKTREVMSEIKETAITIQASTNAVLAQATAGM